jgi:hypothetical protein
VQDYPFSTLQGLLGTGKSPFLMHFTRVRFEDEIPDSEQIKPWLNWLNQPFPKEAEELIQKTIRKRKIDTILDRNTRKPIKDSAELI